MLSERVNAVQCALQSAVVVKPPLNGSQVTIWRKVSNVDEQNSGDVLSTWTEVIEQCLNVCLDLLSIGAPRLKVSEREEGCGFNEVGAYNVLRRRIHVVSVRECW